MNNIIDNGNDNNLDNNLENKISHLKKITLEYEALHENEKLKNGNMYDEIIKEKELCIKLLNDYKKSLASYLDDDKNYDKNDDKIDNINEDEFNKSMERIIKIKKTFKLDEMKLDELIKINLQLNNDRKKINHYLNNKKMEIIKLN